MAAPTTTNTRWAIYGRRRGEHRITATWAYYSRRIGYVPRPKGIACDVLCAEVVCIQYAGGGGCVCGGGCGGNVDGGSDCGNGRW